MNISKLNLNSQDSTITISARVEQAGEYITAIYIDTDKSFVCISEPSNISTKLEIEPNPDGTGVVELTDYTVNLNTLIKGAGSVADCKNNIIFIYIEVNSYNESLGGNMIYYTANAIFDQNTLYKDIFTKMHKSILSNKNSCCVVPDEAARLSVLFEAFQLSWATADARNFIRYWDELHDSPTNSKNCNCNGK